MVLKPIPIGSGYYITEDAIVVSKKNKKTRIMQQHKRGHGYYCVSLTVEPRKSRNFNVHKLMALAFFGEAEGREVRHLNGNKLDNNINNLKYGTTSENQMDRVVHGTSNRGSRHGMSVLTEDDVKLIKNKYSFGKYGYKRLAKDFKVSPSTIQDIIECKTWKHI